MATTTSERLVEVLVLEGCPNTGVALERARTAVAGANLTADVRLVHVSSDEEAKRLRFLGSPTVRVDGADIDPTAQVRDDFGLQCRLYSVGGRLDGAPPVDWISSALGPAVARDLVSRPWARAAWYGFALVAVVGIFVSDYRALLWTLAFGASGLMCTVNAIRSGRFHCMYTGPIFFAGALVTILRAAGLISFSWAWIGAAVLCGVASALVWERARHQTSTRNRCC